MSLYENSIIHANKSFMTTHFGKRSVHIHRARIQTVLFQNFDNLLLVDEGRKDLNTALSGQSKRHLNNDQTLNSGLVAL